MQTQVFSSERRCDVVRAGFDATAMRSDNEDIGSPRPGFNDLVIRRPVFGGQIGEAVIFR
jgi:hypothetical protein